MMLWCERFELFERIGYSRTMNQRSEVVQILKARLVVPRRKRKLSLRLTHRA
jgi:hypothetical protein